MGIDLSLASGVGFEISASRIQELVTELELSADEIIHESVYEWTKDEPLVDYGAAGTFYASEPENSAWVAVKRTVREGDQHDLEAGYFDLSYELTDEEFAALIRVAEKAGVDNPRIGPFFAVHWH